MIRAHVSIDDKVLLVGPGNKGQSPKSEEPPMDMAAVFFMQYLSQGTGRLDIIDVPKNKSGVGWHDLDGNERYFKALSRRCEFRRPRCITADVLEYRPQEPVDVIWDHGTLDFINWSTDCSVNRMTVIEKYLSLLKNGGKILLAKKPRASTHKSLDPSELVGDPRIHFTEVSVSEDHYLTGLTALQVYGSPKFGHRMQNGVIKPYRKHLDYLIIEKLALIKKVSNNIPKTI